MLNFLMAMMSGQGDFTSDMQPNLQITFQPSTADSSGGPSVTSPTLNTASGQPVRSTANPLIEEVGSVDLPTAASSATATTTHSSGVGSGSSRQLFSVPNEFLELVAALQEPEFQSVHRIN